MRDAADGGIPAIHSDGRNDGYGLIVSDLKSLIEHVQASMRLIETAIANESPLGNQETSVFVLDDVTPRYVKANAALNSCNAGLGAALHLLLDSKPSREGTGEPAGIWPFADSLHRPRPEPRIGLAWEVGVGGPLGNLRL